MTCRIQVLVALLIGGSKFSTKQKHYPYLGSVEWSVWNFCACSSNIISRWNCWWRREMSPFSQAPPQADGPSSNPSKQKNITAQTVYSPKMKTVPFSGTDSLSATNCSIGNPSTPIWFHPPIFETQGCALSNWDMGKLVDARFKCDNMLWPCVTALCECNPRPLRSWLLYYLLSPRLFHVYSTIYL